MLPGGLFLPDIALPEFFSQLLDFIPPACASVLFIQLPAKALKRHLLIELIFARPGATRELAQGFAWVIFD